MEPAGTYILEMLRNSKDLSTGSEELLQQICDLPTQYFLSGQRADLLRPFADSFRDRSVLELGKGSGAITRFLGECGADVIAEGLCTDILAERCRDQDNVRVTDTFEADSLFDAVLLTEVEADSVAPLIARAAEAIREDGVVILAVENALGLKHLKRCETARGEGGAAVFGKEALTRLLHAKGFVHVEWYYPFPDHRFPAMMLKEGALNRDDFQAADLIRPFISDPLLPALLNNRLMGALANSFLLVAGKNTVALTDDSVLAYSFNSGRRKRFNKTNVFYASRGKGIRVRRIAHFPDGYLSDRLPLVQVLREEGYVRGVNYLSGLVDILSIPGWSAGDLRRWARPYFDLVRSRSVVTAGRAWLEGIYVDLTPFNMLDRDGRFEVIDLEWVVRESLPMEYVLFRGLYHCLERVGPVAPPAAGTPVNAFGLCLNMLEGLLPDTAGILEDFLVREVHYFGEVFPVSRTPGDFDLSVGEGTAPMAPLARWPNLYPLLNLNLQVFVGNSTNEFSEANSITVAIGLSRAPRTYTVPLSDLPVKALRLRIDPSDHPGLVCIHSVRVKSADGVELCGWTPFSGEAVTVNAIMTLHATPDLEEPVFVLLDADPMIFISLGEERDILTVELELSAPSGAVTHSVLTQLQKLKPYL